MCYWCSRQCKCLCIRISRMTCAWCVWTWACACMNMNVHAFGNRVWFIFVFAADKQGPQLCVIQGSKSDAGSIQAYGQNSQQWYEGNVGLNLSVPWLAAAILVCAPPQARAHAEFQIGPIIFCSALRFARQQAIFTDGWICGESWKSYPICFTSLFTCGD